MNKRLFIVFILGFSSGLPMALISSTLQAWFAYSGMSVFATGTLSLISLPYAYRIFWGPILDRYSLFSMGKRRSWILSMQCLLLLGFNLMAWFTPEQYPKLMAFLALIIACFSATQDIAIDAHRAEYLPTSEHALGASLAVLGYRIALLLSGGLALVMAQKLGWAFTYRFMGLMMIAGMFAVFLSQEPSVPIKEKSNFALSFLAPIKELVFRPGVIPLFLFIFCYKLGEAFTTTTSGIVMPFLIQGLGFSLETIGYINKMLGVGSILLGGLCAGFLLIRFSLYRSLLFFGLLQALTNVLFVALAIVGKNVTLLAIAVFFDNFAAGMGSTALVALFMRLVNKQYTGTQFSMLVALSTIPRIISGPVAASIQMAIGWVGLYQLSILFALAFIPFLILIKEQTKEDQQDLDEVEKEGELNPVQ
ncbi:MFS transporter [Legionella anisa]|uniref:MFS transporter n=1 Tax=Legionella anisa TaxID=28082 RepID=A0AAX0WRZ4_9GAMM|nr:MFS transporter [Legionella anisa]AWN74795.1 MFS transporter [Legionella anisa]KTC77598.1 AmpG protein [Legionella anisa]MBN5936403.1 MFS transporter [Legionella anisa]MCW8425076.1 MFS transporter [Legionella anisa]MCW8445808.1 MFS transporter [Legionella anisa]